VNNNIQMTVETNNNDISLQVKKTGKTSNYEQLTNKPLINDVELIGNKTTSDLGIVIPDVSNFITKDVDDLTNYYLKTETYTQAEVNSLVGAISNFHYQVVAELPETGQDNILYLVPKPATRGIVNYYDEYVYSNGDYELIGTTQIDLSDYVQKSNIKTTTSTTTGDVYDVTYINTMLGDIESLLGGI